MLGVRDAIRADVIPATVVDIELTRLIRVNSGWLQQMWHWCYLHIRYHVLDKFAL